MLANNPFHINSETWIIYPVKITASVLLLLRINDYSPIRSEFRRFRIKEFSHG